MIARFLFSGITVSDQIQPELLRKKSAGCDKDRLWLERPAVLFLVEKRTPEKVSKIV